MNKLSSNQKRISTILKLIVIVSAVVGTFISAYAGRHSFMGGSRVFMYFTIQSNILIAVVSCIGLFLMNRSGAGSASRNSLKVWHVIKFVSTISITLTGVVFGVVLAPTLGANAWNFQNTLTHLVVPVAAVIDFFVIAPGAGISRKNVFYVIIPPILYAIYAGIGYIQGWEFADGITYPYFFLNWGSPAGAFGFTSDLPFMGTAWWILLLLVFLIVIGYGYLALADLIDKLRKKR
ncbi:MAG: Pr6Pr family membrane protein [Butyrivibrio sp.]|nr:Pr6Pr family membrane protein [Butyrivibrio sp.]